MSSYGTANIPSPGKTLNVVLEINLHKAGEFPALLKFIKILVRECCQDFELLIKELSLNLSSRNNLRQDGQAQLLQDLKYCWSCFTLHTVRILLQQGEHFLLNFLWRLSLFFHFIWKICREPFDWMWSVCKRYMKYLCILWFLMAQKKRIVALHAEHWSAGEEIATLTSSVSSDSEFLFNTRLAIYYTTSQRHVCLSPALKNVYKLLIHLVQLLRWTCL